MKIDGKGIADAILSNLTQKVLQLKESGIVPTLAVILVGDDPESLAYIRQKQKVTERIGGRFIFEHLPKTTTQKELTARVAMYNRDPEAHGLIVQRPLPTGLTASVDSKKDVDGFVPNSPFPVPIVQAIFEILKYCGCEILQKNVVIIGRGETAGKPIAEAFAKLKCTASIVHSQTPNPKEIMKKADIIISCVGKETVVAADAIKPGAILISVGLWRGTDNKLHGDYNEEEIQDIASYYTPTPGGVGPLNIACLMQNLVKACTIK